MYHRVLYIVQYISLGEGAFGSLVSSCVVLCCVVSIYVCMYVLEYVCRKVTPVSFY